MYKILILSLFSPIILFSQNDSTITRDNVELKEIIVSTDPTIKTEFSKGKYELFLTGTNFQKASDTWEGLKMIPIVQLNAGIMLNSKPAILEINGIKQLIPPSEIENFIKGLDPKVIHKIELITNPNSSYENDVKAVINIIIKEKNDSYRIILSQYNGYRSDIFNNSNLNFSKSTNKYRIYLNYGYNSTPTTNIGKIIQQFGIDSKQEIDYEENNKTNIHRFFFNLNSELSKKLNFDFTSRTLLDSTLGVGRNSSLGTNFNQNLGNHAIRFQFAETIKLKINDSSSIKFGSYQVSSQENSFNKITHSSLTNSYNQTIHSKIPILIGFIDYNKIGVLGERSSGLKIHSVRINNDNSEIRQNFLLNQPFEYTEKVFSLYQNYTINGTQNNQFINLGLRYEFTNVDYKFSSNDSILVDGFKLNNLFYRLSYNWISKNKWNNSINLDNNIIRPNYSYLNPFLIKGSDVIANSGNSKVVPTRVYNFGLEKYKDDWNYYLNFNYFKDFISSFFENKNNLIVSTYKNFDQLYVISTGLDYSKSFFENLWINKTSFSSFYNFLKDSNYKISNSSPQLSFSTNNQILLGKTTFFINYQFTSAFRDGLIKHYSNQNFNINISRKLNAKWTITVLTNDLFRTNRVWEKTTLENYLYNSNYYYNERFIGLNIRFNFTSSKFKPYKINSLSDGTFNRLEK